MRSCHPQWWSRSYAAQEPNYNVPNAATRLTFRNGALRCEFHPPRQTQCLRPAPFDVNGRQLCFRHCYPKEHDNWWTRAQALAEPGYQDWGAPTLRHFTFRQYSRRCEVRIQAGHQCWRPAYFLDRNGVQFCGIVPGHLPRDEGSVDDDGSVDDEGSVDNDDDPNHGGGVGSPKSPGPSSDGKRSIPSMPPNSLNGQANLVRSQSLSSGSTLSSVPSNLSQRAPSERASSPVRQSSIASSSTLSSVPSQLSTIRQSSMASSSSLNNAPSNPTTRARSDWLSIVLCTPTD